MNLLEIKDMLKEKMILFNEFSAKLRQNGFMLHEFIRAVLVNWALENNYIPYPEYMAGNSRERIDLVIFSKDCHIEAGFEIDKNVSLTNINKLLRLGRNCEKSFILVGFAKEIEHKDLLKKKKIKIIDLQKNYRLKHEK